MCGRVTCGVDVVLVTGRTGMDRWPADLEPGVFVFDSVSREKKDKNYSKHKID